MIHLVYPYDLHRAAAPWSIGNHLAAALREAGHVVRQHDWTERGAIVPGTDDVLLGHWHPDPATILAASWTAPWRWRGLLCPWNGADDVIAGIDAYPDADHFCLICGPYWAEKIPARWRDRATPIDMAVDTTIYRHCKIGWHLRDNRIVYVGCATPHKGTHHLTALAAQGIWIDHIGVGQIPGTFTLGYRPLELAPMQAELAMYDILLSPGIHDANPAVVLEAASIGLIPVAMDTAGWGSDVAMIVRSSAEMATLIRDLCSADLGILQTIQIGLRRAASMYTWQRFCDSVIRCLAS